MAFLDVVGELLGFSSKTFTIVGLDPGFKTQFEGEFIAQNLEETIGSFLGEASSVNKESPTFAWVRGEAETVSFVARIWKSSDVFASVNQEIEALKSFARRDPTLKRAPKVQITIGTDLSFVGFIRGLRLSYDEIRTNGALRGATVAISFQKTDIRDEIKDAASNLAGQIKFAAGIVAGGIGIGAQIKKLVNVPGASLFVQDRVITAKRGDTMESIAAREYGDPLKGDILRRVQPDKANPQPGDDIILIEASDINGIRVTQQSVALKNTPRNLALREIKLTARNRPTQIFI